jgi:hypothetical protein
MDFNHYQMIKMNWGHSNHAMVIEIDFSHHYKAGMSQGHSNNPMDFNHLKVGLGFKMANHVTLQLV